MELLRNLGEVADRPLRSERRQANPKRLWDRSQQGHVHNIYFTDFCRLIEAFGFEPHRQEGSHRMYARDDVEKLANVQP